MFFTTVAETSRLAFMNLFAYPKASLLAFAGAVYINAAAVIAAPLFELLKQYNSIS